MNRFLRDRMRSRGVFWVLSRAMKDLLGLRLPEFLNGVEDSRTIR